MMRARSGIALLLIATMLGTSAELLLVEHTEDPWQVLPLALLGLGVALTPVVWRRPHLRVVQAFQVIMILVVISAALGLWFHYRANAEFELEMYPAMSGFALFWKAIHGASPPSLAPGAMFVIGVLGLIWSTLREDS